MGVYNLTKFLKTASPRSYRLINLNELSGNTVAIDISVFLYQFKSVSNPVLGSTHFRVNKFIDLFMNFITILIKNGLKPVFVFDGPSPLEKKEEQEKRTAKRNVTTDKINKLTMLLMQLEKKEKPFNDCLLEYKALTIKCRDGKINDDATFNQLKKTIEYKIHKLRNQATSISVKDSNLIRELFDIFKITYINAKGEADALCSYLYVNKLVDSVISDDNDFLAYGVTSLFSNLNVNNGICTSINYTTILEDLEYNHSQFLDFCIMCGTDYNSNIFRVGPSKSYKYILEHKNIENIVKNTKITKENIKILKHDRVREMYLKFPYILSTERDSIKNLTINNIQQSDINWNALQRYLFKHNCMYNETLLKQELGFTLSVEESVSKSVEESVSKSVNN